MLLSNQIASGKFLMAGKGTNYSKGITMWQKHGLHGQHCRLN